MRDPGFYKVIYKHREIVAEYCISRDEHGGFECDFWRISGYPYALKDNNFDKIGIKQTKKLNT